MQSFVSFRCSACKAKLKAPVRLVGQGRPCPACREHITLQPVAPAPAEAVLVFDDMPLPPDSRPGWIYQPAY